MTDDELLMRVLWNAIEDDSGLWEARWEINTHAPDWPVDLRDRRARDAVRELLRRGWIEMFRQVEPYGARRPLDATEAERTLDDESAWEPAPFGQEAVRISATPAGEAAYEDQA